AICHEHVSKVDIKIDEAQEIQLLHDGIWGHICLYTSAPELIGKVLCRQLGEDGTNGQIIQIPRDHKWAQELPVWHQRAQCYGNESHIQQCQHDKPDISFQTVCSATKISTLTCHKIPIILRSNNKALQFGIVEAYIAKRWLPVYRTNQHAVRLICQVIGLDSSYAQLHYVEIQRGSYNLLNYTQFPINIHCKGTEHTLEECQIKLTYMSFSGTWGMDSDLYSTKLAGVRCPKLEN
ncbi:unnamed protein product, partial [Owenia fusiformis]